MLTPEEKLAFIRKADMSPGIAMLELYGILTKEITAMLIQYLKEAKADNLKITEQSIKMEAEIVDLIIGAVNRRTDALMLKVGSIVIPVIDEKALAISLAPEVAKHIVIPAPIVNRPTDEELLAVITPLIQKIKSDNVPSRDYLLSLIRPLIPIVENQPPITDDEIIALIESRIPKTPALETAEQLFEKLNSLPLDSKFQFDASRIKNLPKTRKGALHGGGITSIIAGTNITATLNSDGSYTLSASGGTWYQGETVGGPINGSNVTFTLAHTPVSTLFLYLGHQLQIKGVDYTLSGATITYLVAPDASLSGDHYATYS